jgi:hypothetical protein
VKIIPPHTEKNPPRLILIAACSIALTLLALVIAARWFAYIQTDKDQRNKLAFQTRLVEERVSGLFR